MKAHRLIRSVGTELTTIVSRVTLACDTHHTPLFDFERLFCLADGGAWPCNRQQILAVDEDKGWLEKRT